MAAEKDPWFVIERSRAVAVLMLTSQGHTEIVSQREKDDGVDLLVGLGGSTAPPTRLFVVQVKGTASANPTFGITSVEQLFRPGGDHLYLPACVFVVNVRDNTTRYAWIAEPITGSDRATLKYHHVPIVYELTDAAVNEITTRVTAYYDVMPKQLLATG